MNSMVYSCTLLNYSDWLIIFTVHTYDSDNKLVTVIKKNNKTIAFLSRILIKPHNNYTMTKK